MKHIRQKRDRLRDTGQKFPETIAFLFSFFSRIFAFCGLVSALLACESPEHQPELSLFIAGENSYPMPKIQVDRKAFRSLNQEDWKRYFRVYVGDSLPQGELAAYPVLGTYSWRKDALAFHPRLPWQPEQTYFAYVDQHALLRHLDMPIGNDTPGLSQSFQFHPPRDSSHVALSAITPATDSLPANALRIYLHFDAPMKQDTVYRYVKLLDEKGQNIPQAFVEAQPPLFDPSGKRLTLIFHPGRVKQGIAFGDRVGAVLAAGKSYRLQLDSSWQDQRGRPLAKVYQHDFEVVPADRKSPDPAAWSFQLPQIGSKEPMKLFFDEKLDPILARRMIHWESAEGMRLSGEVKAGLLFCSFAPDSAWKAGDYWIVIDPRLEDLAGNRPGRLFDSGEAAVEEGEIVISFRLK